MKKLILAVLAVAMFSPSIAFAASQDISGLLSLVSDLINAAIPILVALAVLFFFYGLAIFILKAGDPEGRKKGIGIMIWGIVALFVIVSVWGLVAILQNTIGTDESAKTSTIGGDVGDLVPTGT